MIKFLEDVGSTLVDKNFTWWRKPYLTHYYVILSEAKNLKKNLLKIDTSAKASEVGSTLVDKNFTWWQKPALCIITSF